MCLLLGERRWELVLFYADVLAAVERFLHFDGLVLVSVRQNAELLGMDGVGRRRLSGSTQKDCHEGKEKDLLLSGKTLKCTIYYPGALINRTSGYSFPQSKPPNQTGSVQEAFPLLFEPSLPNPFRALQGKCSSLHST